MSCHNEPAGAETMITHTVDFETCYVTQRGGGVIAVRKGKLDAQEVFAPPQEWGDSWRWNVLEDGSGVYLRRTRGSSGIGSPHSGQTPLMLPVRL